jgi:DNA ligase-1
MQMKTFPILYSKSSSGEMKQWTISVNGDTITTVYGRVGGKLQTVDDIIREGKNIGKANETSTAEQAQLEAESKWTKKKKSGYVESLKDAEAGVVDALIEGGVLPMLAHKYSDRGDKIVWPAFIQPKFDGHRCIAIVKHGKCELWSRTRKRITSMPHIVKEIEEVFTNMTVTLDGELYNHDYKNDFEKITSKINQKTEPAADCDIVQYHVYDYIVYGEPFNTRHSLLDSFISDDAKYLKKVETEVVMDEDEAMTWFNTFRSLGYEGAMLRNKDGLYMGHQTKRSLDLQKIKEFDDEEFPILDVKEGRGKLQGHAIFICGLPNGETFDAKMRGDTSKLKEFFENHSLWKNKILTVKYQGYTKYNKPRFPVAERIREDV